MLTTLLRVALWSLPTVVFVPVLPPGTTDTRPGAPSTQVNETPWSLGSSAASHEFDSSGVATGPGGATVSLKSTRTDSMLSGNVSKTLVADAFRMKRVRLSGSLRTAQVGRAASLYMRVDAATGMLILDNGMDRALRGSTEWTDFSVTLPVPQAATRLVFGVLLTGGGQVEARNLRFEVLGDLDPKARLDANAKKLLDAAIDTVRRNSVFRDTVSWNVVIPEVRALAAGATSEQETYPAIRYLLARLGDNHSMFLPPVATRQFQSGGADNPQPDVRLLAGGIGYVNVPFFSGGAQQEIIRYSNRMHSSLSAIKTEATCGWIVDLRRNSGGNMYPMLSGLRPFLGEGTLGYWISPGARHPWTATMSPAPRHPRELDGLGKSTVAVITGPRTVSSGEIVAISFRERNNTRSFGLPTGGYSTANQMFPMPGGSTLNLTTSIDADRKGRKFGGPVEPDERVEPGADGTDTAQERAKAWIMEQGCKG